MALLPQARNPIMLPLSFTSHLSSLSFTSPISPPKSPSTSRAPAPDLPGPSQIAVTSDVLSSSEAAAEEEAAAAAKIGRWIRVKAPLRVYHMAKVPDLDLGGMEGTIKQYLGVWKGKRISANLPFKVEFLIRIDGQDSPVKFFAHLREDEFEYVPSSDGPN
ncbi:ferredoxin-thioredoxin reductase, variable chain-like [Ananas comosus]|uniref:Ferredoxin-thioredoxin reductase, variable chain-like n=1 Tax=Ananas comosus TaxID=4615 RepID=A0A6P5EK82_ANACO|nr:ferredoxin-thioredoxin reductase, variable chain-like [Ananas comosus]